MYSATSANRSKLILFGTPVVLKASLFYKARQRISEVLRKVQLLWSYKPNKQIVYVGENENWYQFFQKELGHYGHTYKFSLEDINEKLKRKKYSLVIIDADEFDDSKIPDVVRNIRKRNRKMPIVIIHSAPTWSSTRSAFQAKSTDVIAKPKKKRMIQEIEGYLGGVKKEDFIK